MVTAATGKAGNGAKSVPDLEDDIKQLKADLEKLAKQLAATGEHGYSAARRAAAGSAEQLRTQGEATLEDCAPAQRTSKRRSWTACAKSR